MTRPPAEEVATYIGRTVRDRRTGLVGRVIAVVIWDAQPNSLVVQPPVRADFTVPPTVYVTEGMAEMIAQPAEPQVVQ